MKNKIDRLVKQITNTNLRLAMIDYNRVKRTIIFCPYLILAWTRFLKSDAGNIKTICGENISKYYSRMSIQTLHTYSTCPLKILLRSITCSGALNSLLWYSLNILRVDHDLINQNAEFSGVAAFTNLSYLVVGLFNCILCYTEWLYYNIAKCTCDVKQ